MIFLYRFFINRPDVCLNLFNVRSILFLLIQIYSYMERKEAIDIIRKNWPDSSFTMLRVALETLIPELVESEDEKIRKYVIDYFKGNKEELSEGFKWNGITVEEVIDWLEKQGEQKPVVIATKFREGDTIKPKAYNENHLIKKITDKGYVLDVDIAIPFKDEDVWELVEQKPEWSEEDKRCLMSAIAACEQAADEYEHSQEYIDAIDWLRSIKDKILPQPKPAWSEEDEKMFVNIKSALQNANKDYSREIGWFHLLRLQKQWRPSEKQINALSDVLSLRDIKYDVLSELLECLKKRREE